MRGIWVAGIYCIFFTLSRTFFFAPSTILIKRSRWSRDPPPTDTSYLPPCLLSCRLVRVALARPQEFWHGLAMDFLFTRRPMSLGRRREGWRRPRYRWTQTSTSFCAPRQNESWRRTIAFVRAACFALSPTGASHICLLSTLYVRVDSRDRSASHDCRDCRYFKDPASVDWIAVQF